MTQKPLIIYTFTDEAPALATMSLYPLISKCLAAFGVDCELRSVALADRVLALLSEYLPKDQQVSDELTHLAKMVLRPDCQIIKLPNISASLSQLKGCIAELQEKGYGVPDYPEKPEGTAEQAIQSLYKAALGSAVNPRLRIGNSHRYIPPAVKKFAGQHPHPMGVWSPDSQTTVYSMSHGDFYRSEQSFEATENMAVDILFRHAKTGELVPMAQNLKITKGDVVDGACLSKAAVMETIQKAKKEASHKDVIFSLHLKATMMKVSDPLIFGYALEAFLPNLFSKYQQLFAELGIESHQGLADLENKIKGHKRESEIADDLAAELRAGPRIAMVDSSKGITNFHVSSDMIIDASMAAMIRGGGKLWDHHGQASDTMAVIPDSSYGSLYDTTIEFCKRHGAFDPKTMGSVANMGLMAHKAEEYGSHPTTFVAPEQGQFMVYLQNKQQALISHDVSEGDIWRMCHTHRSAIDNWIQNAVDHARDLAQQGSETKTIFWLDSKRSHDQKLRAIVAKSLEPLQHESLNIEVSSLREACQQTLSLIKEGKNVVSVTGNVLRDYITDLFPILELGTSAKMLSVVQLLSGGRMFETGSGGTAPKHVDQLLKENHLRWDSLGEFLALEQAVTFTAAQSSSKDIAVLADALKAANQSYLDDGLQPSRKVGELDTRGSHFLWLCQLTAAVAKDPRDFVHKSEWIQLSESLMEHKQTILAELLACQGQPVDIEEVGYYHLDRSAEVMRPSKTLAKIWSSLAAGF